MEGKKRARVRDIAIQLMMPTRTRDGQNLRQCARRLNMTPAQLDKLLWDGLGYAEEAEGCFQDERGHWVNYDPRRADRVLRSFS